jgi:hypothetical protein
MFSALSYVFPPSDGISVAVALDSQKRRRYEHGFPEMVFGMAIKTPIL